MQITKNNKHWKVLACISGLAAATIGVNVNTIGVFYTPVSESLGFYRGSFALHTTILVLVMSIVALFIPRLLNRVKIKKIILFGVVLTVTTIIVTAFARSLWSFYLLAALRGIGAAFISPVPLTIIINNWFDKKNGLALSLGFGSSGVAGAFLSPFFNRVILDYNWQIGFLVMALASFLFCLPALLYKFSLNPIEENLLPYGAENVEESIDTKVNAKKRNIKIFDNRFVVLASIGLLLSLITGIPHHLPGYAETIGYNVTIGAWMLSASMVGNIVFKLLAGMLGDWRGAVKTANIILSINGIAVLLLLYSRSAGVLILSSFLLGGIMCFPVVILPMLTIRFYNRKNYMKVYPFFSFMTGVGGAFGVSIIGYIYDFTDSYESAFYSVLVLLCISICMILYCVIKVSYNRSENSVSIKE